MCCRECMFNATAAFECPFFSSGTFSVEERDSCPDFMQVRSLPLPLLCRIGQTCVRVARFTASW